MPKLEYSVPSEQVWEEAHKEHAMRPFLKMAQNAEKARMPKIAQTLKLMAEFTGAEYKNLNGDNPLQAFVDSRYAKNVSLSHLPYVELGFAVADINKHGAEPHAKTQDVFHRGGHNFNRGEAIDVVGRMIAMLGIAQERKLVGQQQDVLKFEQPTKMGVILLTTFSPYDISVGIKSIPAVPKRT